MVHSIHRLIIDVVILNFHFKTIFLLTKKNSIQNWKKKLNLKKKRECNILLIYQIGCRCLNIRMVLCVTVYSLINWHKITHKTEPMHTNRVLRELYCEKKMRLKTMLDFKQKVFFLSRIFSFSRCGTLKRQHCPNSYIIAIFHPIICAKNKVFSVFFYEIDHATVKRSCYNGTTKKSIRDFF